MKTAIRFLLISVLLFLFASSALAGPVSSKLTADEIAKMKAGEILLKNDLSQEKKSGSGVAYAVYKCPIDEFWKAILDYDHYTEFFPRIKSVQIVEKKPSEFYTAFQMDATITTLKYTSFNKLSADKLRLDFGLDERAPHKYFKAMSGYWQLEPLDDGSFLAEYKVSVELDVPVIGGMISKIVNSMAGKDLPTVMKSLRKRIDSGHTWKLKDGGL